MRTIADTLARAGLTRADVYDAFLLGAQQNQAIVEFLAFLVPPDGGAQLLDAGCGTGRLLAELLARGYRVSGVEPDPDYARRAREQGASVSEMTFEQLTGPARFQLVALVNGPLCYVTDRQARRASLRALRASLVPGGCLVVDNPHFTWFLDHYEAPQAAHARVRGVSLQRSPSHRIDTDDGLWTHTDRIDIDDSGTLSHYQETFRFAIVDEQTLLSEIEEAGFVGIETWTGWSDRSPRAAGAPGAAWSGPRMLLTARSPQEDH